MERDDRQLKNQAGLFLLVYVAIFSFIFLMAEDGKAADPSAGYPSRPIEYITHGSAGSGLDTMGRLMAEILQKEKILSQPMFVSNKVGANGATAFGYVLEKKGNPHIVLGSASTLLLSTPMLEKLPYNYKSFTPIASILADGNVLVVRKDSPCKTIDDLFAEAKKRPKQLLQGGGALLGSDSLMGRSMQIKKGVQWNFVSFAGAGNEAMVNLLSGAVDFVFNSPNVVVDHVRAGKVRVLLAGAPNRYPEFKDAPTYKEAGLGEPIIAFRGLLGSSNMPDYAVKKLEAAFKKVTDSAMFKKYLGDTMSQPFWMPAQEYSKFLDDENERWKKLLTELNLVKK